MGASCLDSPLRCRGQHGKGSRLALALRRAWCSSNEYCAQVPGRFVVRFLPDSDCEDIIMSWAELLGEQCCLASTSEKAVLLHTLQSQILTLQPRGQPPTNTVWDQRKAAWVRSDGMQHNDVSLDSTLALHVRICIL